MNEKMKHPLRGAIPGACGKCPQCGASHANENPCHACGYEFKNVLSHDVEKNCSFSTGICETLTCSHDGFFDDWGYPVNKCPDYPCEKIESLRLKYKAREEDENRGVWK